MATSIYNTADKEGMILPDGVDWFPGDDWDSGSFLWGKDGWVWISMAIARKPGNGAFSRLIENILASGRGVVVPTAFPQMNAICRAKGFHPDFDHESGCELMVLPAPTPPREGE